MKSAFWLFVAALALVALSERLFPLSGSVHIQTASRPVSVAANHPPPADDVYVPGSGIDSEGRRL